MMISLSRHPLGHLQVLCIIFILCCHRLVSPQVETYGCNPDANTRHGPVRGFCVRIGDRWIRTFLGIPYATPPVGDLRFQLPRPLEVTWNETYHSIHHGPSCPEPLMGNDAQRCDKILIRNEDCLYLNIWSPQTSDVSSKGSLKPVLLWVHGGGLIMLSGNDCLINSGKITSALGDFVIVTANFRLGALGFLCLPGSSEFPCNMGLHDLVLAMQWLHENIEAFGGDPKRITIGGLSSGGFTAGLLYVSGAINDYVNGLIVHSGAPGDTVVESADQSYERFKVISKNLGCRSDDQEIDSKVIECVKKASVVSLLTAQTLPENRFPKGSDRPEVFLPTLDGKLLPKSMKELWEAQLWPKNQWVLISSVSDEGHIMRPHFHGATFLTYSDYVNTISQVADVLIPNHKRLDEGRQDLVKAYAVGYENASAADMEIGFRDLIGDWYIRCLLTNFGEKMSQHNKVYTMKFTYTKKKGPLAEPYGTRHGIEVYYCFGGPFRDAHAFTDLDRSMSVTMINIWSDFVHDGHSYWPSYQVSSTGKVLHYQQELDLSREIRKTALDPDACRCEIWQEYYDH